jgi:hypothetical protein
MRALTIILLYVGLMGCNPSQQEATSATLRFNVRHPVLDVEVSRNGDILEAAASYPDRTTSFRDSAGAMLAPKYGDPVLDRAADALSDIARPWTLGTILKAYEAETDLARRCHLLRAMAASRDPRMAIQLHDLLDDESLDIRMAALSGLWDHFVQVDGVWAGGTEQMFETEANWWNENKALISKAASTLAEQDDTPELPTGRKPQSTLPAATR